MTNKVKAKLALIFKSVLFWCGVFILYGVFRNLGLEDEPGITIEYKITFLENVKLSLIVGTITGTLYGMIEILFDKQFLKRKTLGVRVLFKTIAYFFLINIMISASINVLNNLLAIPIEFSRLELFTKGAVWSFVIYFLVCSSLYSFFRIVNEKFGRGVLVDMLLGKYSSPRVEKKIFMFLDLKSSTTLAEQMGYLKYSSLIQQCFYDLNEVVQDYDGEIYQYVGDEAVISWDYEKGVKENGCIDCYFAFQRKLFERKDFYERDYGLLPEFKAGLHGGDLVVTEVGVVKKEIAYHGDVINTTARIQAECNTYDKPILVSQDLVNDLSLEALYVPALIGEVMLKGKEVPVKIHSLSSL